MLCAQLFKKYTGKVIKRELSNVLKLELFSYHMAEQALQLFQRDNLCLERFDPIVGDSSCQIRADKILELYRNKETLFAEIDSLSKYIPQAIEQITAIQELYDQLMEENHAENTRAFFAKLAKGWDGFLGHFGLPMISLSEEVCFLIQCYIITHYCSDVNTGSIKIPDQLGLAFGFSLSQLDTICSNARKMINKITKEHLDAISKTLAQTMQSSRLDLLNASLAQVDALQRFESHAAYTSFALLFLYWLACKTPLKFEGKILCNNKGHPIHKIIRYYYVCSLTKKYVMSEKSDEFFGKAGIVLQGITDLTGSMNNAELEQVHAQLSCKAASATHAEVECQEFYQVQERIKNIGIKNILLASGATHHQFMNKEKEIDFTQLGSDGALLKEEYEYYKELGNKEGLSKANPSTVRLTHIYSMIMQ